VRGLALPAVEVEDMKREARIQRAGFHLISQRLSHLLRTTVNEGHQAILLLNRRGYSSFVYCASCQYVSQCRFCDATMTYHRSAGAQVRGGSLEEAVHTGQLHCHYCLAVSALPSKCPDCGKKLVLFGMGTQRVEEELAKRFPDVTYARVDSDTMRRGEDYRAVFDRFERNEVQVLLGTQMIAKGLDYPNVTLVGVINADIALAMPDFRAGERTFQLITQVAGRAGRGDTPGRVVLQSFMPDDPAIQGALKDDYCTFAQRELDARRELRLPPIMRMVRIIVRDEEVERVHERAEKIAGALRAAMGQEGAEVILKGPMPCVINRIKGYHRAQVLLFGRSAVGLQGVLAVARRQKAFAESDRVAVDVDPVSLL